MPDIDITINTPILTGGDTFLVRYRELPSGIFSAPQTETNATFTLTGLTAGDYELEVIVVKDDVECPAIFEYFTVLEPYACETFGASILQTSAGLYEVNITYPVPASDPPCGYLIQIIGNVNNKSIPYATLPASPLKIPIQYEAVLVRVLANMCNSQYLTCYEADLTPPAPICTPLTGVTASIEFVPGAVYPYRFRVTFAFTQSNPPTIWMVVLVQQTNVLSGLPGKVSYDSFFPFGPLTPTQVGLSVMVDANPNVYLSNYDFDWLLVDVCGKSHKGHVHIQL